MVPEYTITPEPALISVTVEGLPDYLSIDKLWNDIVAACNQHQCFDILGTSNLEPAPSGEAYSHAAIFEAAGVHNGFRIAWVEENPAAKEWIKLSEAVVRNRDLATARAFDSVAEAKRWLVQTDAAR